MPRPDAPLLLQNESLRVLLDPEHGGAIQAFEWRSRPVFRRTPPGHGGDPIAMACFPMVPYANRIAGGRFDFGAASIQLKPNWDRDPHPLHGEGWRRAWHVSESDTTSATLAFDGGGADWPWRYRAEQQVRLAGNTLSIRLSVTSLADSAMPIVLGLHPFFPDPARARVLAHAERVWLTDAQCLPIREVQTPSGWSLSQRRPINAVPLDHCFTGWSSVASIVWPDHQVTIRAAHCNALHVYAPAGQDFFCLEPQSGPAGAHQRGSREATQIGPGECFTIEVDFEAAEC